MAEVIDYGLLLPKEAPEGTIEYCKEHSQALNKEYLIYRCDYAQAVDVDLCRIVKNKVTRVYCSKCGQAMNLEYVPAGGCRAGYAPAPFGFMHPETGESIISRDTCLCPMCGEPVTALHIGAMSYSGYVEESDYCMTVGRLEDKLTLLGWQVRRLIDKNGQSTYSTRPYEGFVVEKKKMYRLSGRIVNMGYSICYYNEWRQRAKWSDEWGDTPMILPWDSSLLEGSAVENCKLDGYIDACDGFGCYPASYLRLYQKHPQVENLIVQGVGRIVSEAIQNHRKNYTCSWYGYPTQHENPNCPKLEMVNWKENRPTKMLGISKSALQICREHKVSLSELELYRELQRKEKVRFPEDLLLIRKVGLENARRLAGYINTGLGVMRQLRYLDKQNCLAGVKVDAGYLIDYWKMSGELGLDIRDTAVSLPKNIRVAHDRVDGELKAKRSQEAIEKRRKEIEERKQGFANTAAAMAPYEWTENGICIRVCISEEELIAEGATLHHCVASYAGRIARGETAIFFIRKETNPDEPWYTLELDSKTLTVRQNRGKKNCDRTPEVQTFEEHWLEHLRTLRKAGKLKNKKNKKESAA